MGHCVREGPKKQGLFGVKGSSEGNVRLSATCHHPSPSPTPENLTRQESTANAHPHLEPFPPRPGLSQGQGAGWFLGSEAWISRASLSPHGSH